MVGNSIMAFNIASWRQGGRSFSRGRSPAKTGGADPRERAIGRSIMLASGTALGLALALALREHSRGRKI